MVILLPVFDVLRGMDWLHHYRAVTSYFWNYTRGTIRTDHNISCLNKDDEGLHNVIHIKTYVYGLATFLYKIFSRIS